MITDSHLAGHHHKRTGLAAAGDSDLGTEHVVIADLAVVPDHYMIIQFAAVADAGRTESTPIDRGAGADFCILYREDDFLPIVKELTDGKGVDVVYDSVGRETIARSIRSLRRRGTCIMFGTSSGVVDCIEPLELAEAGSVFFTRPHLADYTASAEEIAWRGEALFQAAATGRVVVSIDREFPLEDARHAHETIEGRRTRGKLLLRIGE